MIASAMGALEAGQIPASVLARDILADRDRLLEEVRRRDQKIANLERCLSLSAQMIDCLQKFQEADRDDWLRRRWRDQA